MAAERKVLELSKRFNREKFRALHDEISFGDYLDRVYKQVGEGNTNLVQSAYQRIYSMIVSKGMKTFTRYRKTVTHYNFFDDDEFPIFGLEENLMDLVKALKGAAGFYGAERRILLLHGPVGSSKSTLVSLLKRGLEKYSQIEAGEIYTYRWINLPKGLDVESSCESPMQGDPLSLIPLEVRIQVENELNNMLKAAVQNAGLNEREQHEIRQVNKISLRTELNPRCRFYWMQLMRQYNGDWGKVVNDHITVHRFTMSESDRRGIGTFQPKDEKNQDSTELTGDINYAKLSRYGADSDPRAFNFDGEFNVANRGMLEFIEILKLAKEFLYDLLGAAQERQVKPKKFPQVHIDLALLSHTNNPEYEMLKANESMEAFRDRTLKVDVPYLIRWSEEQKIYKNAYGSVPQHIAPHTLEIAALWAVLTRLEPDEKLTLVEKSRLYDGQSLPGYTEDAVKELQDKHPDEGMKRGVSARYVQNKISNALVGHHKYINPFMVLNEIKDGLKSYVLITKEDDRKFYSTCVSYAQRELDEILKKEVMNALVSDQGAIERMFTSYTDSVFAYIDGTKVQHPYTGKEEEPDERLMRSIEEKIDISEQAADDFRRSIAAYAGKIANEGGKFRWDSNVRLQKALELKLFEDTKDTIKVSKLSLGANAADPDTAEKIDAVKTRMVNQNGYIPESAADVLDYVASIFARGDIAEDS